jgi:hypothetical protein
MSDIARLQFAQSIRVFHHAALWEEEKHFTWLNSLILSAQLLLFNSEKIPFKFRFSLILVVSLLGVLASRIALRVIRKEGEYFCNALNRFVDEHNSIFPDKQLPPAPTPPNKSYPTLLKSFLLGQVGVRDAFQVVFLAFGTAFVTILVITAWFR